MLEKHDSNIKKANSVLDYLANDEETMRLYLRRQMAIHDEVTRLQGAHEEGLQKGLEKGLQEGKQEGMYTVIHSMVKNGATPSVISKLTGLPLDKIEAILKNKEIDK